MPLRSIIQNTITYLLLTGSVIFYSPAVPAQQSTAPLTLSVMTYNLRYASEQQPNAWSVRRPLVDSLLSRYSPDIMGTQEGLYHQLNDLENDLGCYRWIGIGREGGSRGEFCAVFYKDDRFVPVAYDYFWLSDTPDVMGSITWGNACTRMVTWVLFSDRASNRLFYVLNTHLDHQSRLARKYSAKLICRRTAKFQKNIPIIMLGDFNAVASNSKPYDILTKKCGFADAWEKAATKDGQGLNTFNDFKMTPTLSGERIDWILYKGCFNVARITIIDDYFGHRFPSDHFPVMAWLMLP